MAWELLLRIERDAAYLDRVLDVALLRAHLSASDRALLTDLVHGVVRWKRWLDFQLQSFAEHPLQQYPLPVLTALRIGAYQLLFLERIPEHAAVHQAVELIKPLGKRVAGLVNAILRTLLRHRGSLPQPSVATFALLRHSALVSGVAGGPVAGAVWSRRDGSAPAGAEPPSKAIVTGQSTAYEARNSSEMVAGTKC
ncbi:MAG: transcription antitermination factor NusB [Bacteroidota bacterium]|nr:transcription antitermination factor NusB [Bacteroidota bacterium]